MIEYIDRIQPHFIYNNIISYVGNIEMKKFMYYKKIHVLYGGIYRHNLTIKIAIYTI